MKRVLVVIGVIAVVAMGVFIGLKNEKEQNQDVIKIGFVLPMTGDSANHGKDIMQGAYMALDDFKERIGATNVQIRFLEEDNFSTSKGSVSAFENLIQIHKPWIILGPVASSDMLALVPIAEKSETVLLSPTASSPSLSNAGKFIFRIALLAPDQTSVISKYAYSCCPVYE